jgi:hypothetical protein
MALRISDQQAKELGIAEHIPKRVTRATNKNKKGQNKLEAKFDRHLADLRYSHRIEDYWFEEVKFRLAGRTFYTPDFVVACNDASTEVFEVKGGHFRDDARVKIKVAAEKFPYIRWSVVRWIDGRWEFEIIPSRGSNRIP